MTESVAISELKTVINTREKTLLLVAYAFGGAVALTYQIVWFHAFVERFGATGTTFLTVLCSFIEG